MTVAAANMIACPTDICLSLIFLPPDMLLLYSKTVILASHVYAACPLDITRASMHFCIRMRGSWPWLTSLGCCCGIALWGCFLIPEEEDVLAPPLVEMPNVAYNVVEVQRKDFVRLLEIPGQLVPALREDLFFRFSEGRLGTVGVTHGDLVEERQLLAELDTRSAIHQIKLQEIALAKAQIEAEMARALGKNKFELQIAELSIEYAQLQLRALRDRLEGLRLRAPFAGYITYVGAIEGRTVQPYSVIMTIVDPHKLVAEFRESERSRFAVGTTVTVRVRSGLMNGTVVGNDKERKNDEIILVDLPDLPENAAMNESATLVHELDRRDDTIVILRQAVHHYLGDPYVNVLLEGHVKEQRDVKIGITIDNEVEILEGLVQGEKVIVR